LSLTNRNLESDATSCNSLEQDDHQNGLTL
jgi:hypothetical protein